MAIFVNPIFILGCAHKGMMVPAEAGIHLFYIGVYSGFKNH